MAVRRAQPAARAARAPSLSGDKGLLAQVGESRTGYFEILCGLVSSAYFSRSLSLSGRQQQCRPRARAGCRLHFRGCHRHRLLHNIPSSLLLSSCRLMALIKLCARCAKGAMVERWWRMAAGTTELVFTTRALLIINSGAGLYGIVLAKWHGIGIVACCGEPSKFLRVMAVILLNVYVLLETKKSQGSRKHGGRITRTFLLVVEYFLMLRKVYDVSR